MDIKSLCSSLVAVTLALFTSSCDSKAATSTEPATTFDPSSTLVVYFSWSGNLEKMSGWIANETGGIRVRVETVEAYPTDHDATISRAKKEHDEGIRPAIRPIPETANWDSYKTIFIGFPVWWYDIPMPLYTFLEGKDFKGKTVIPFFSHEGSSNGAAGPATIEKLTEGAKVLTDQALSIRGKKVPNSEQDVRDWVRHLQVNK
jgi:flavodoxin